MSFNDGYFKEGFDTIPKKSSNVTDRDYQCSDDYLIQGNQSKQINNTTMMDCKEACIKDGNCIGFNYDSNSKVCTLQKNANAFNKKSGSTFCIKKSLAKNQCAVGESGDKPSIKLDSNTKNNMAFNELHNIFSENDIRNEIELKNTIMKMKTSDKLSEAELKKVRGKLGPEIKNKLAKMKVSGELSESEINQIKAKIEGHISSELSGSEIKQIKGHVKAMKASGELQEGEIKQLIQIAESENLTKEELKEIIQTKHEESEEMDESDDEESDDELEDEESEGEELDVEDMENITEENHALSQVEEMLQENKSLNEKITKKMKHRKLRKKRTKIYVNLKCFLKDMHTLSTHSEGIMIELPLLLSYIKSCAYIRKRKISREALKRKLQRKLKKSGRTLTEAEKEKLESEIKSKMSKKQLRMPKPDVVKLEEVEEQDDVETFYSNDSNYDDNTSYFYENYESENNNSQINNDIATTFKEDVLGTKNNKISKCTVSSYTWSWDFMTVLKVCLLVLLLVLIFNKM